MQAIAFQQERRRLVNNPPQDEFFQSIVGLAQEALREQGGNKIQVVKDLISMIRDDCAKKGISAAVIATAAVDLAASDIQ